MTQASSVEINLEEVSNIELGAEGIRVTWRNGEKKFISGEIGFELYQQWIKHAENGEVR
jgi:hypothetical protein